ncbi:hypothetical protein VNO77_24811 [Canavalia gladiata]|uniref:NFD4 C-terminal domain-containing protein n=1 Tax=Canavalia gladiata TaxID=3824 RepID=A0AAN9LAC0_CANGL
MESFIFGYSAALIYHKEGYEQDHGKCMDMECYKNTFLISGSFCLFVPNSVSYCSTVVLIFINFTWSELRNRILRVEQ